MFYHSSIELQQNLSGDLELLELMQGGKKVYGGLFDDANQIIIPFHPVHSFHLHTIDVPISRKVDHQLCGFGDVQLQAVSTAPVNSCRLIHCHMKSALTLLCCQQI